MKDITKFNLSSFSHEHKYLKQKIEIYSTSKQDKKNEKNEKNENDDLILIPKSKFNFVVKGLEMEG
jgi:hypothetical protein